MTVSTSLTLVSKTPSRDPFPGEYAITPPAPSRKPLFHTAPLPRRASTGVMIIPVEPDDAHITGATRSLSRRLLALNIRQDS